MKKTASLIFNLNKFYSILLLAILIFFSVNLKKGNIIFGHSYTDILYEIILKIIIPVFGFAILINWRNKVRFLVSSCILSIPAIWIILLATFWRGDKYRWNGEIFYPSKASIEMKENQEREWKYERDSIVQKYHYQVKIEDSLDFIRANTKIAELNSLLKDNKEAIKYYEKVIEMGDVSVRHKLVSQYMMVNMNEEAMFHCKEILKGNSTDRLAKLYHKMLKSKMDTK